LDPMLYMWVAGIFDAVAHLYGRYI